MIEIHNKQPGFILRFAKMFHLQHEDKPDLYGILKIDYLVYKKPV